MKLYNALDIKAGAKVEKNKLGVITQPLQFLSYKDKDDEWRRWNLDWLEQIGLKQVRRQYKRMIKNYKLANGVIDKSDYIIEEDNEVADLIEVLTKEDSSALELKFYPIVPNVINILTSEFSKRNDRVMYRAVDELSYNEMLEEKSAVIEQILLTQAEAKMAQKLMEMGVELDSEEAVQALSPDNLKTLPEVEAFYKKDYKSMHELWAEHQHNVDSERFKLNELELTGFKDMLTNDVEVWHFKLNEDDYDLEVWNPVLSFWHVSPDIKYISQGNYAGRFELMSISDVIDKFGYKMTKEQIESLEHVYPVKAYGYIQNGVQNDGSFYDASKSHKWNTQGPSLGMRQFQTFQDTFLPGDDIISLIYSESATDGLDSSNPYLFRVMTAYWKSQRKLGWLSKIDPETGFLSQTIVTEDYKVYEQPVYDQSFIKEKSHRTLISGEHVEWIWINQVWGGIKIGPNRPNHFANESDSEECVYLDVKPVKFQFKGDYSVYGCKLPVEGCTYTQRNTRSMSLVDRMKAFQVGYNLVNNQISDLLIDELGTVILLDQNFLPQESMGEDWGRHNYAKAYVAMKNFQVLPLDTSISNTENPTNFNHFQALNLEQTNRLLGRIQLANYFKQQAFEVVGITPQRMGAISSQETATGVEQAINNSYVQTEMYFVQHSEHLMPRIHQMRTDLAQYYHSTNPSVRLSYMTSADEKINFEINGTELLLRDINIFVTTKVNQKAVLEQMRQLALNNNTAGASIYDLGTILKAESLAELNIALKRIEEKATQQQQMAFDENKQIEEMIQNAENERLILEQNFEAEQNQLDREKDILVAKIRAATATGTQDIDANNQNDYLDTLKLLEQKEKQSQDLALRRQSEINKLAVAREQLNLKREELQTKRQVSKDNLAIAIKNKNYKDK